MFQARYPTSVLIIGTYQIRFSDTDFESILVRRLDFQYEKLKVIENNYNCAFHNITELNNKINNIKPFIFYILQKNIVYAIKHGLVK
jgi:hypothetical protein